MITLLMLALQVEPAPPTFSRTLAPPAVSRTVTTYDCAGSDVVVEIEQRRRGVVRLTGLKSGEQVLTEAQLTEASAWLADIKDYDSQLLMCSGSDEVVLRIRGEAANGPLIERGLVWVRGRLLRGHTHDPETGDSPRSSRISLRRGQLNDEEFIDEGLRAGDPARPSARTMASADQVRRYFQSAKAQMSPDARSFITAVAPTMLRHEGCEIEAESPIGIPRADGALNGYRVLAECRGILLDVQEMDYRSPLTMRARYAIPDGGANIDLGTGNGAARFYRGPDGDYSTIITWVGDRQEIRFWATGRYTLPVEDENRRLIELMRRIVQQRAQTSPKN